MDATARRARIQRRYGVRYHPNYLGGPLRRLGLAQPAATYPGA